MGSITLRSLTLYNFRSFLGLHRIVFPAKGLVILRGDSGSGKTNILLALAYAFGYCRHSARALQCWFDDDDMYVEVELDTPEGVVTIRRGIKGIAIGKQKGKAAEAILDKLCGVPTELREILTYRDQVRPKKFLDMRDTALKQFLTQVLQLHGLDKEIDKAEELLGGLEDLHSHKCSLYDAIGSDFNRCKNELVEFYPESTAVLEDELSKASVALTTMEYDLTIGQVEWEDARRQEGEEAMALGLGAHKRADQLEAQAHGVRLLPPPELDLTVLDELKAKRTQASKFMSQLEAADKIAWREYEDATAAVRVEARKLHNELALVPGLVDDINRLTAEADKLKADLCDRCGRQWDNAKIELKRHQDQLDEKHKALDVCRTHKVMVKQLDTWLETRVFTHDPRLAKLDSVSRNLDDQIKAEQRNLDSYEREVYLDRDAQAKDLLSQAAVARAEGRAASMAYLGAPERQSTALKASQEALKGFLEKTRTQLAELRGKLALVRQANVAGLKRHDEQVAAVAAANKRKVMAQTEADTAEAQWKAQSDYVDLLKGFRNKIFDEVLEAISADATAIIGTLPNSQHISINFQSERETAKGTVQERITPVTYLHGAVRDLEESVSGGQLTSIGLAVDLAVAGVISQRLGCHLNWIVLDESFEGHDVVTKLACLEMLQAYAADKLVIIVDHMSEFKEMFSKEIRVVFSDKLSSIV